MKDLILSWISTLPGASYLDNPYIMAGVVLVLFILLAFFVLFVFHKYLEKIAHKTKSKIDDMIFDTTKKPIFYLILIYGIRVAVVGLNAGAFTMRVIDSFLAFVFSLILLRVFDTIVQAWGDSLAKKTKTNIDDVLLPLVHKALKVIFVIVALLWILKIWSIDITPYLAGAGILGLVLGMALQDSLKNVFGGVSLIMDKNFNLGDAIRLESGELGTISEIGLRSTKMLSFDREVIFVPNGQLANMRIRNFVKPDKKVRKIVEFGVEYGSDPEKVKKVVLGALKKIKDISDDPYMDVILVGMGDSSLNFKARFWVDWDDAYGKWVEATQAIYSALEKAGIKIPFPTRTVYMKNLK